MAEVLARFGDEFLDSEGTPYSAQACGREMTDGLWEGWIEFVPNDGTDAIRTSRETTQPNRVDAKYWATGLSPVYLEGALRRALSKTPRIASVPAESRFDAPAPRQVTADDRAPSSEAVLDPFAVYQKGERLLRQELGALSAWHLVNIVTAYDLSRESATELNRRSHASLVETIVQGVR